MKPINHTWKPAGSIKDALGRWQKVSTCYCGCVRHVEDTGSPVYTRAFYDHNGEYMGSRTPKHDFTLRNKVG
jgi:hypothetical protein